MLVFDGLLENISDDIINRAARQGGGRLKPFLEVGRQINGGGLKSFHHRTSLEAMSPESRGLSDWRHIG